MECLPLFLGVAADWFSGIIELESKLDVVEAQRAAGCAPSSHALREAVQVPNIRRDLNFQDLNSHVQENAVG